MQLSWQDAIVLPLVFLAAAYVAWQVWRMARRPGGCGSSGGCSSCSQAQDSGYEKGALPLVELKPHGTPAEIDQSSR